MKYKRIRRVSSKKELEQVVDDFVTIGYEIENMGETSAYLIKKGKHTKHGLIAALTIWWTLGIGNLIYALIPVPNEDEVMIKLEKKDNGMTNFEKTDD